MLVAAAFCPATPLLHPTVAAGAADELADLRAAAGRAAAGLRQARPDVVVTVGAAPRTGPYPVGARGTLAGYGVDVVLGGGSGSVELPPTLALAAWLAAEAGLSPEVLPFGVAPGDGARCRSLGAGLAERAERVALLVVGDGTACRDAKAPGSFDERAEKLDGALADALGTADLAALDALDVALCDELLVSGRPVWQVAAGAAAARDAAEEPPLLGELLHAEAPYGVGYVVASWSAGE